MANIKSAIKRVKTTQAATERNIAQKNAMRTAIKAAETAKENNAENVEELVNKAISLVDKASNLSLIHISEPTRPAA